MKNLEIKAKYPNNKALELVKLIQISDSAVLKQVDTYFNVHNDRLKLREINCMQCELIWYNRADQKEERTSHYEVLSINNGKKLKNMLTNCLGIKVVINKTRKVFIYKDCRIHIDHVEKLGEFLEFEVVMVPGRSEQDAVELMEFLRNHFQVEDRMLVEKSYSDLCISDIGPQGPDPFDRTDMSSII